MTMDHDHLPALSALLFAAPFAVLALAGVELAAARGFAPARGALARISAAPTAAKLVAVLAFIAGAIHLGLVPGHSDEPFFAAAFAVAGAGLIGLAVAALLQLPYWRPAIAAAVALVLAGYIATRLAGLEGIDSLGVASGALELATLALLVTRRMPAAGATGSRSSAGSRPT